MPIAPITGRLRKRMIFDLSASMTLGLIGGYSWWYFYHLPYIRRRDAYYAKLEAQKQ